MVNIGVYVLKLAEICIEVSRNKAIFVTALSMRTGPNRYGLSTGQLTPVRPEGNSLVFSNFKAMRLLNELVNCVALRVQF